MRMFTETLSATPKLWNVSRVLGKGTAKAALAGIPGMCVMLPKKAIVPA